MSEKYSDISLNVFADPDCQAYVLKQNTKSSIDERAKVIGQHSSDAPISARPKQCAYNRINDNGKRAANFKNRNPKRVKLSAVIGDRKCVITKHKYEMHLEKCPLKTFHETSTPGVDQTRGHEDIKETLFASSKFSDIPLHPHMVANLRQTLGLDQLTVVQKLAIPVLCSGRDAFIRSQTGSGKTIAYAVPLVEALHSKRPKLIRSDGVMAIVVVPTRELALQTYQWFLKLVKPFTWIVPGYLAGGEKRKSEKARLRRGVNILVSTPGRLVDHVCHTKNLQLFNVKYLVLDEADRMLDMGYEKDISSVVSAWDKCQPVADSDSACQIPHRQTVLLSATLTPAVTRLAGLTLKDPSEMDVSGGEDDSFVIPHSIVQRYMVVPPKFRLVILAAFIAWKCKMTQEKKLLVFCATQDIVDYLTDLLNEVVCVSVEGEVNSTDCLVDVKIFKLHGSMSQTDRTEVFNTFRKIDTGVLMCTDVASRGLDLPQVDWVLQWTAPPTPTDYVHRVGRTARGGNKGAALLFLAPTETPFLQLLGQKNIRPMEDSMDHCLQNLLVIGQSLNMFEKHEVRSEDTVAAALQHRFEMTVVKQPALHTMACKAFTSFVRFYSTYPRETKEALSVHNLHLGHYAKGFALKDSPSAIGVSVGRMLKRGKGGRRPVATERMGSGRSHLLLTSEYASGLSDKRRRKRGGSTEDP